MRHWLTQPRGRGPSQTPKFLSPGPPSPWLPALLVGNCFLPFSRRTVGSARGCKGRSPLHKITFNLPLPRRGRGGGGMGAESKLKAGEAGDKEGKPPPRIPERQGLPATSQASPPPEPAFHKKSLCRPGSARGCKGRSPLHKITFSLPLPRRGRGLGGWGQKSKQTARSAGDKAGKPPNGFRNGKVCRQPAKQAPRRNPLSTRKACAARVQPGDARGEAPCIRKL